MRQLISVLSMAAALAWSGVALAVVDEQTEVPVTGTPVPNATLVITDETTGKTISTSKVTNEGKTTVSIHEPQLTRKSKVTVTLKNEKGETIEERKGVLLGWIFERGIAFNAQGGGQSSETANRPVARTTHHTSEQPRARTVITPAPTSTDWYRGFQIGLGGDFGGAATHNNYDDFPAFSSSGVAGGGHFDARYYFLRNVFAGFNAGLLGTNIKGDNPENDTFANYKWEAWEMGQIGLAWTPPGTTTRSTSTPGRVWRRDALKSAFAILNR